ncbi:cobalamin biosynthesis protein [Nitrogeniibacter mangrovi]|uniref:Cobalamin biosynthesis protein CobD n=1 Tax=Nitrogeniibacter mangrovi TaxID=2016596 RepID=A0A6C1B640_9RHOO|nr:adenosylcobinamide-phosphate synthase CbiB [Nitrogeniibacter mangrovi]QID19182.1 cobalamin biosynthesis protein [Nitrogeniibacter mangrovi]
MPALTALSLALLAGVLLDRWLGEPTRWHPLVGFGRAAGALERRLNRGTMRIGRGALAWALVVLPPVALAVWVRQAGGMFAWALDAVLLMFCLGANSLAAHARAVAAPLRTGDLSAARAQLARIVSRDTDTLSAAEVAGATTESVLENGHDAIFGALFWFLIGGGPAALLFRLANTLDAMWGYRTPRFERFGRLAARADDGLGWLPARLTAATYALVGQSARAWRCWRTQAPTWKSPNAGPVMAAGAGALGVSLGGPAPYHGRLEPRPALGEGAPPDADAPEAAIRLVEHSLRVWIGLTLFAGLIALGASHA